MVPKEKNIDSGFATPKLNSEEELKVEDASALDALNQESAEKVIKIAPASNEEFEEARSLLSGD